MPSAPLDHRVEEGVLGIVVVVDVARETLALEEQLAERVEGGLGQRAARASRRAHHASTSSPGCACAAMHSAATSSGTAAAGKPTAATNRSRASMPVDGTRERRGRGRPGRSGGTALEVGRAPTPVAVAQLRVLPIGAGDHPPARRGTARAVELVVVVAVGHGVVEAELLTRRDVAHRHEEHRSDDPAVGLARMVHVVGVVERRHARDEEVVVDLQRVDPDPSSSRPSSSARSTTCPPKPATVVPAGIASTAKIPLPFGPADRVTASGLSQDWRTGASMGFAGPGDRGLTIGAGGRGAASRNQAARQSGHNTGVGKRQEREKLARRRIASTRRSTGDHGASTRRPPVRAGHLSPRRSVPAGIPRPPYAPDAPALLPAVPPDEIPDRMRAAGHAAREVLLEVGAAVAAGVTTDSSTASATTRTSRGAATRARSTTRATRSRCAPR